MGDRVGVKLTCSCKTLSFLVLILNNSRVFRDPYYVFRFYVCLLEGRGCLEGTSDPRTRPQFRR